MSIEEMFTELTAMFDDVRVAKPGAAWQIMINHHGRHVGTYSGRDLATALRNAIALSLG